MRTYPNDLATAELIKNFVLANLHIRYSPLELSKQFNVSERFVKKDISKLLGKSLAELAHEKRMLLAVTLLNEGVPLKQIAAQLGYNSAAYFSTVFKKHYECAPNAYTKKK
jgi:AraC-like DNA-binding protein